MSQQALIKGIKEKADRIIADNRQLRDRQAKLREANDRLRGERAALRERVAELERRVNVLELSASMGGTAQQKELAKARVNRLMREVDRCIALIGK